MSLRALYLHISLFIEDTCIVCEGGFIVIDLWGVNLCKRFNVPVVTAVVKSTLTALSFNWFPAIRNLGALSQGHNVISQYQIVQICACYCCKLLCPELDVNMLFFDGDTRYISEIAE
jgi:hypothetical protein